MSLPLFYISLNNFSYIGVAFFHIFVEFFSKSSWSWDFFLFLLIGRYFITISFSLLCNWQNYLFDFIINYLFIAWYKFGMLNVSQNSSISFYEFPNFINISYNVLFFVFNFIIVGPLSLWRELNVHLYPWFFLFFSLFLFH